MKLGESMKRIPLSLFGVDSNKASEIIKKLNSKNEKLYLLTDGQEWYLLLDDNLAELMSSTLEYNKEFEKRINELESKLSSLEMKINKLNINEKTLKTETSNESTELSTTQKFQEETQEKLQTEETGTLTVCFVDESQPLISESEQTIETEKKQFYCKKCNQTYTIDVPKGRTIELVKCPAGHTIFKRRRFSRKHAIITSVIAVISLIITYLFTSGILTSLV